MAEQHGSKAETLNSIPRDTVFSVLATEAAGFYKLIVTVVSSFLGGTILFLDKLAPRPTAFAVVLLGVGWVCLIASVVTVAWIRQNNLSSGYLALARKKEHSQTTDQRGRCLDKFAVCLLAAGMFFVAACGAVQVWDRSQEQEIRMPSHEKVVVPGDDGKRSIPFGETVESKPAEQPAEASPPAKPATSDSDKASNADESR